VKTSPLFLLSAKKLRRSRHLLLHPVCSKKSNRALEGPTYLCPKVEMATAIHIWRLSITFACRG